MKAFQLNEKLKEILVLEYKAYEAKTTFYSFGTFLLPEPFYETIIKWPKDLNNIDYKKIENVILKTKQKLNKFCYFEGPLYEETSYYSGFVWALFHKEIYDKKGELIDYLSPN
jgi:hypothetical protein